MTRRTLLVEPSATMRHVLEKHARALGHEVEATESYATALEALRRQYRAFESDIACVLYGWPSLPDADADALAAALESEEFADLPVIVMSTDMRAETRAWVAGRERTAVLAWKDYLGVDALLERLLDVDGDGVGERVAKFDNGDIHLLVVDDSLTIRYSLRDLFELHGYRVSLAATREEALAAARETRFDIAVLDFYLEESTGDALCRDLVSDPACGDVVCAILTGTYADHVIKRSLRAGAVECMFKNESSELLLTRIDAIARFVRQRRELGLGLGRLERVVETLAGAVLVVDADGVVRHVTRAALAELGLTALDPVTGQSARTLLGIERLPDDDGRAVPMTWRDATGRAFPVSATRRPLPGGGESLLGFERAASPPAAPARSGEAATGTSPTPPPASPPALPPGATPFVGQLERYVGTTGSRSDRVSLLVLGVHTRASLAPETPGGEGREPDERKPDGPDAPELGADELGRRVLAGLGELYRREHHVADLGRGRFGLLIRHGDAPQSYLLTRRLMQLCNDLLLAGGGPALACTGCLVGLENHVGRAPGTLLDYALRGLEIVEGRGVDQALLLDLKRMLAVYPAPAASGGG